MNGKLDRWLQEKDRFYKRMIEDREIGYLDPGIDDILEAFFAKEGLYTTSSCIGRITLVKGSRYWSRDEAIIVYKKHGHVSMETVASFIEDPAIDTLWIRVTGPIFHISAYDMRWAKWVLELGRKSGFKHSGIFSIPENGFLTVEMISSVQATHLLKIDGHVISGEGSLRHIVRLFNLFWDEGVMSARRLYRYLLSEDGPASSALNNSM
ncbi:MAG: hypothetical protein F7C32_00795 [Desulfurococcales archaeon]|nr:hypothetical protein [Desulfurococcales archaeon]